MSADMRPLVTIVTGASRGIGSAIVESLAKGVQPVKIYAISRSGTDLQIDTSSPSSIVYTETDVSEPSQIASLVELVRKEDGRVDRLINNAGVNVDYERKSGQDKAEETIDINYRGPRNMCEAFLPLLNPRTGRIVNVSSVASKLRGYSPGNVKRLRSAQTLADVDQIASDYLASSSQGDPQQQGWSSPYCVSKALVNAMTIVVAKQIEQTGILCNACCPGWVDSDMGSILGDPPKSLEEGAKIITHLAFSEEVDGISGRYWENSDISGTGVSHPSDW